MSTKPERTEQRTLPVTLTEDEIAAYAYELARKEREATDLDGEKKAVTKDFQGRIDLLRSDIASLAKKVETRSEDRQVDCDVIFFDETNTVALVRRDTGEEIQRRPMSANERQKELLAFGPRAVETAE